MADSPTVDNGGLTDYTVSSDEVTIDTVLAQVQRVKLVDGANGGTELIGGDAANGLDVDVTRLPALAAGTNNIGDVDVLTLPALVAGTANIGDVDVLTVPAPLSTTGGGTEAAALRVTLASDSTGVLSVDDNGSALTVDNGGTFATQVDGAALTALQLIDDPVQVLGTDTYTETASKGVTIGAVRRDADTTLVGTTNEFGPLQMDANGRLKVEAFSGETLPVSGTVSVNLNAGTTTNEVVGDVAHDSPIGGNPVRIGGRALSADYTAVATGDTADLATSLLGKQVILPHALPGASWQYAGPTGGITDTADDVVQNAGAAGVRHYVTSLTVVNSHATVGTEVVLKDGASTVIHRAYAAAGGGGYTVTFPTPLRGTAATALNVACITTGSATNVSASGFSAAE